MTSALPPASSDDHPALAPAPDPSRDLPTDAKGERVAKRLARAGVASRREIERMIADGRVSVDGEILTSPARNVTASNRLAVDGQPVGEAAPARLWRFHKTRGTLTTNRDPQGRPTIFDKLPPELPRVVTIGRLDFTTEGLLLLTNDGGVARALELPQNGWLRHYRARAHGDVDPRKLAELAEGVTVEGVHYEPIRAVLEPQQAAGTNRWIFISLREGKNREIRKVMLHLKLDVTRLIRIAFGPFQLGKLAPGAVEEVPPTVARSLLGPLMGPTPHQQRADAKARGRT